MSITNGYLTLDEIRGWMGFESTQPDDDVRLEIGVEAASRHIDGLCHRRFFTTAADETRYYTASHPERLTNQDGLDDIVSITTLKTDEDEDRTYEITWATTDYDLSPYNVALDSKPYTRIDTAPDGDYEFPTHAKGVQIVGKFGYCATAPTIVKYGCYLLASYLFTLKNAPLGVTASPETGQLLEHSWVSQRVWLMLKDADLIKDPLEA